MPGSSFKTLKAWRHARLLVRLVYRFTDTFPPHERFVLASQMRRAAHSVHLNIAGGSGRLSNGEWQHFLGQSRGSLMELESATIVAFDLEYCSREEAERLTEALKIGAKLVNGLLRSSMRRFATKKFAPQLTANS